LTKKVGKVKVKKPTINYLEYTPKDPEINDERFEHLVEIYGFDPSLKTADIVNIFRPTV